MGINILGTRKALSILCVLSILFLAVTGLVCFFTPALKASDRHISVLANSYPLAPEREVGPLPEARVMHLGVRSVEITDTSQEPNMGNVRPYLHPSQVLLFVNSNGDHTIRKHNFSVSFSSLVIVAIETVLGANCCIIGPKWNVCDYMLSHVGSRRVAEIFNEIEPGYFEAQNALVGIRKNNLLTGYRTVYSQPRTLPVSLEVSLLAHFRPHVAADCCICNGGEEGAPRSNRNALLYGIIALVVCASVSFRTLWRVQFGPNISLWRAVPTMWFCFLIGVYGTFELMCFWFGP